MAVVAERVMMITTISAMFSIIDRENRLSRIELPTSPRQSVYRDALQMRFIFQHKLTRSFAKLKGMLKLSRGVVLRSKKEKTLGT